jgi:hypothetical protein
MVFPNGRIRTLNISLVNLVAFSCHGTSLLSFRKYDRKCFIIQWASSYSANYLYWSRWHRADRTGQDWIEFIGYSSWQWGGIGRYEGFVVLAMHHSSCWLRLWYIHSFVVFYLPPIINLRVSIFPWSGSSPQMSDSSLSTMNHLWNVLNTFCLSWGLKNRCLWGRTCLLDLSFSVWKGSVRLVTSNEGGRRGHAGLGHGIDRYVRYRIKYWTVDQVLGEFVSNRGKRL